MTEIQVVCYYWFLMYLSSTTLIGSFQEEDVRKRLSQYHTYAEELEDYYHQAQRINADQDPHTVFECIESMVVNQLPRNMASWTSYRGSKSEYCI